ncbi:MAG: DUF309 domain-containing protein [Verrucomicrobia bacterium]|nr:DUF309 domain-containing protein [Verrucomicrobiota bacterium]
MPNRADAGFELQSSTSVLYSSGVSRKSGHIGVRIASFQGQALDAHYLGFFDGFNRQQFYEAHDVLEELWLADRHGSNGAFYKGLIQLAGAFVHLQKARLRPAAALFKLARGNLEKYPEVHERLAVGRVVQLIKEWEAELEAGAFAVNPLRPDRAPQLALQEVEAKTRKMNGGD